MKNRIVFLISSFIAVLAYKNAIREEPWAIGFSQVIILCIILTLFYVAVLHFERIKLTIRSFFNEVDSPVNLAFFRIIFFGFLVVTLNGKQQLWFSQFPKELQFAPMGMVWLLPHLPINFVVTSVFLALFKLFCFLTMIGWLSRFSAVMAVLTGFYVLGIPQFYGSVSHNHHLFWLLAVFAASRCADVLSIDAVIKNFEKADRNENTAMPAPSRMYALSLRFIWILIGLCYFFPGFWKLWNSGTSWILGNNLRDHMYLDWIGFDYWLPVLRIDQWPLVCRLSGAGVILFELGFLCFIIFPRWRYFAFCAGLLFHSMTTLLMNISFYALQICYASFLKWDVIFKWCGKKIFLEEMIVLYDGSCSFCRRAIALLQVFDVLGRLKFLDLHNASSQTLRDSLRLSNDELMIDMHAVIGIKVVKGFTAYRNITSRIPLLWVIYPFLFLGFVQSIGNNIYRNVADHRACRIPLKNSSKSKLEPSNAILIVVASILIFGNVIFGFMGKGSGWPFACYPTFSEVAGGRFRTIDCQVINNDGAERTIHMQSLKNFTGSYKIVGLMGKIFDIKDPDVRSKKFKALWEVLSQSDADLSRAQTVRFYFLLNYTDPAKWHLNPINKTLAFEFEVRK